MPAPSSTASGSGWRTTRSGRTSTRGGWRCSRRCGLELDTPVEEAAYGKWLDQTSTREAARQDRIHGAAGLMPTPLWIGLFFISAIVLALSVRVRRQRRPGVGAGVVHGQRGRRRRHHAVAARLLGRSVPLRRRRPPAGGDGTDRAARRPATGRDRQRPRRSLRRPRERRRDGAGRPAEPARRDWVEIVATVLLAFAAVATAWSSYQATRWNGENDQGVRPRQRPAHRRGPRPGARRGPDAGRHRHVLPVGQRQCRRRCRARRVLHRALPPRVPSGLRRLAGYRPADRPRRPTHAVRHGRVPAAGPAPTPSASTPRRRSTAASSAATSSGRPTTCSASSCSQSPCSSPA